MAIIRWPSKKVALDVVDDPLSTPFDGDEREWQVVRVTRAQMNDYYSFRKIMSHIAELLHRDVPQDAAWEQQSRDLHAQLMAQGA